MIIRTLFCLSKTLIFLFYTNITLSQDRAIHLSKSIQCILGGVTSNERKESVALSDANEQVKRTIKDILNQVGLPANFQLYSSSIEDIVIGVNNGQRFIIFPDKLIKNLNTNSTSYWSTIGILVHHLGHHLLGHTIQADEISFEHELDADRWSGFLLGRLGASVEEAEMLSEVKRPSVKRLQAVLEGYKRFISLVEEDKTIIGEQAMIENRLYSIMRVNGLIWMTQDLDFKFSNSKCYEDDCDRYPGSRLYNWQDAKNVCESLGWRLPTNEEWELMIKTLVGSQLIDNEMKSKVKFDHLIKDDGDGFAARLGGKYTMGKFTDIGAAAYYWSSTEVPGTANTFSWYLQINYKNVAIIGHSKSNFFSCRCVKEVQPYSSE